VISTEATHARVFFVFKNEHAMNHGDGMLDLNLCERMGYAPADVLGVAGLALEDDAETNDGVDLIRGAWCVTLICLRNGAGYGGDFKGAGDADDLDLFGAGAFQFRHCGAQHCVDVLGIVLRSDDGKGFASLPGLLPRLDFAEHFVASAFGRVVGRLLMTLTVITGLDDVFAHRAILVIRVRSALRRAIGVLLSARFFNESSFFIYATCGFH